jgi:hypothetical protein
MHADPLVPPDGGKVSASEASLFGCFSPRAKVGSVATAPVMQIMPKLLYLCGAVVMPPSVDEVRSDSHEILDVASPLSQVLGFERSGVVDVDVSLSSGSERQVVPLGVVVAKSGLSAAAPREISDFLATLAAAYPGSGVV